jgi:CRISPR-associated protein Csd2
MTSHLDPGKRHDFVYLFDVINGNPNGDPDADNLPRFDPENTFGLVTDVCLKRKVRNYVTMLHDKPIFIQSRNALNSLIAQAFRDVDVEPPRIKLDNEELLDWFNSVSDVLKVFSVEGDNLSYGGESIKANDIKKLLMDALEDDASDDLKKKLQKVAKDLAAAAKGNKGISPQKREEARRHMVQKYYDIRMFGAVLSTGLNAGQVRGPMQLTFAKSQSPILPMDLTITRQARTTVERMETGTTEIGRKAIVPYGLYRSQGYYSPYLADKERNGTGVTEKDLELFWEALLNMFDHDRSAARGEMACRGLYIFSHDNPKGNAAAHKLFEMIKVSEKNAETPPRQFLDYRVTLPEGITLAKGVTLSENVALMPDLSPPPGVTLTVLEG